MLTCVFAHPPSLSRELDPPLREARLRQQHEQLLLLSCLTLFLQRVIGRCGRVYWPRPPLLELIMVKWRTVGVLFAVVVFLFILFIVKRSQSQKKVDDRKSIQVSSEGEVVSKPGWTGSPCTAVPEDYQAWKTGIVTGMGSPIIKNCTKIIAGDQMESNRVQEMAQKWSEAYKDQLYSKGAYKSLLKQSQDCSWLKETLINNLYNTMLEREFPIAYVFLVYESPLQFLRLFKILYKPQNSYCIHADAKSPFREFYRNIIKCLDNVIASSKLFDVRWSVHTMMEAQVQCFSDLVDLRERQTENMKWNYVINLCSKELPLHTTKEMVQMIQSMKGTSSMVAWPIPKTEWWTIKRLRERPIPYNLTFYKSMAYNALSADFATFMVKDPQAQKVFQFFKDTDFPEEHFYPVLFHMPGAPGGYNPDISKDGYFEVGHYFWRTNQAELALPCFGITVHGICVVNHADLPRIMRETKNGAMALFHNKYFMEKNHVVMDCMEEMIVAKNKLEYKEDCPTLGRL